jgi:hypothetical protein
MDEKLSSTRNMNQWAMCEDELQMATPKLSIIARRYDMEFSTLRSGTMGMCVGGIFEE